MDHAFLLWYEYGGKDQNDDSVLIGVYTSEEKAAEARERMKDKPGFVERFEGFAISRYEMNKDHWTEGFVFY